MKITARAGAQGWHRRKIEDLDWYRKQ